VLATLNFGICSAPLGRKPLGMAKIWNGNRAATRETIDFMHRPVTPKSLDLVVQWSEAVPARLLRDLSRRKAAFQGIKRVEGAAKSLIFQTPYRCWRATNQGVVGSIPASRTISRAVG
jgi:hypothetical protein